MSLHFRQLLVVTACVLLLATPAIPQDGDSNRSGADPPPASAVWDRFSAADPAADTPTESSSTPPRAASPAVQLGGDIEGTPVADDVPRLPDRLGRWADRSRAAAEQPSPSAPISDVRPGHTTYPNADAPAATTAPTRIRQRDSRGRYRSGEVAQRDAHLFTTRETSYLDDPPQRGEISANNSELGTSPAEQPAATSTTVLSASQDGDSPSKLPESEVVHADQANGRKLPWWSMLLFASLAANLFFCWIAYDAHSKYESLISDVAHSDTRRERQQRRLRGEDSSDIGDDEPADVEYLGTADV